MTAHYKAKFVGDPNDPEEGPDTATVFGVTFEKDKWTTVEDPRFKTHSHFETKADTPVHKPEPKADPKPKAKAEEPKAVEEPVKPAPFPGLGHGSLGAE
jgi:hypothetical protein